MIYRTRPDWYALVFQYGLGVVVLWQGLDDLITGQWHIYAGDFFPWRQYRLPLPLLPLELYQASVAAKALLLALYFARIRTRWTALGLVLVLGVDELWSGLNHRLLMMLMMLFVAYRPVPDEAGAQGFRGKRVYWNLDLVRWLVSIVLLTTALHKWNDQFLSGATLWNQYWMVQDQGMRDYPDFLFELLQSRGLCRAFAWATVATELGIAVLLNFRRTVGWALATGLAMHALMALTLPYIALFSFEMAVAYVAFLPDRIQAGGPYRLRGGPPWLARLAWPGLLEIETPAAPADRWHLTLPDGSHSAGFAARIEVLSLSPLTFLPAEILRALSFRPR